VTPTVSVRLGDIADYIRGITFKPTDVVPAHSPGSVVCMTTKNVQESLDETKLTAVSPRFVKREEQYLQHGDLLVSSANSWNLVGKVTFVSALPYTATAGGFISILRTRPDRADPRYVYSWLASEQTQRQARACSRQTTNIANLDRMRFLNLRIPLPSLPEQRRIAAILDKVDAVRRKRQQTLDLADQFLRSAFLDMFGDPVTNPKGWPTLRLGELIEEGPTNGLYRPSSDYGSGTPIVRIDSYSGGDVVSLAGLRRVRLDEADVAKYGLCENDVLVNRVNAPSHLGKTAIVPALPEPIVFESNMMRLRVARSSSDPFFLVTLLNGPALKRQILRRARDAVNQSSINQDDVRSLTVMVPPLKLQSAYRELAGRVARLRGNSDGASAEVRSLYGALTKRAFGGDSPRGT